MAWTSARARPRRGRGSRAAGEHGGPRGRAPRGRWGSGRGSRRGARRRAPPRGGRPAGRGCPWAEISAASPCGKLGLSSRGRGASKPRPPAPPESGISYSRMELVCPATPIGDPYTTTTRSPGTGQLAGHQALRHQLAHLVRVADRLHDARHDAPVERHDAGGGLVRARRPPPARCGRYCASRRAVSPLRVKQVAATALASWAARTAAVAITSGKGEASSCRRTGGGARAGRCSSASRTMRSIIRTASTGIAAAGRSRRRA